MREKERNLLDFHRFACSSHGRASSPTRFTTTKDEDEDDDGERGRERCTHVFFFFESIFEVDKNGRDAILAVELQDDQPVEIHVFTEIKSIFVEFAQDFLRQFRHAGLEGSDTTGIRLLKMLFQPATNGSTGMERVSLSPLAHSLLRVGLEPILETGLVEGHFGQSVCHDDVDSRHGRGDDAGVFHCSFASFGRFVPSDQRLVDVIRLGDVLQRRRHSSLTAQKRRERGKRRTLPSTS